MENGKKVLVKTTVRGYISAIGGIERIEKNDRLSFLKALLYTVNELDNNKLLEKINCLFPTGIEYNNQLLPPINIVSINTLYPSNEYNPKHFNIYLPK